MKQCVDRLMRYIDSGRFFRGPIKVLYILFGIMAFIPVILPIALLFVPSFNDTLSEFKTWWKILSYFAVFLITVYFLLLGFFGFYYWSNRYRDLYATVRIGDKIKAIPVRALTLSEAWASGMVYTSLSRLWEPT